MNNPLNVHMSMNVPFPTRDQNGNINAPNKNNSNNVSLFSFGPNNNASGVNDPQDKDGNPEVMGAIVPPQAGNLFPYMFAMQQRQNAAANAREGNDNSKKNENMNKWNKFIKQQMNMDNGAPSPQFSNANFSSPFGLGKMPDFMNNANIGNRDQFPGPIPEIMKRVIQQAMTSVIDRLAVENQSEASSSNGDNKKLPPHLAKVFAEVLSNENLRHGIAENLARDAPAVLC